MNSEREKLIIAEQKSLELFNSVKDRGLIRAGKFESELSNEIVQLAGEHFGIRDYWHKKIVRAGVNTINPYSQNPPDLIIQDDDILFFDFGLIFNGYEADLGRTYVLGNNLLKLKLMHDVEAAWKEANSWLSAKISVSGSSFYYYVISLAERYGWQFGNEIAGHIVGKYPHEQAGEGNWSLDVHPENNTDIFSLDKNGNLRNWIIEIHFIDKEKEIGGFYEQLMK